MKCTYYNQRFSEISASQNLCYNHPRNPPHKHTHITITPTRPHFQAGLPALPQPHYAAPRPTERGKPVRLSEVHVQKSRNSSVHTGGLRLSVLDVSSYSDGLYYLLLCVCMCVRECVYGCEGVCVGVRMCVCVLDEGVCWMRGVCVYGVVCVFVYIGLNYGCE